MNRWVAVTVVALTLAVGWIAYSFPERIPGGFGSDVPRIIYLVLTLLLVTGAGYGFQRFRHDGRRALIGILFWAALIAAIVVAYTVFN